MLRRSASLLCAALLVVLSACSAPQASRSAQLFFALEGVASLGTTGVGEQELADVGSETLAAAQHAGTIPHTVEVRLIPDTVVLEVTAYADTAQDAARIVNAAVDELADQLNRTDHGLSRGTARVVSYADA